MQDLALWLQQQPAPSPFGSLVVILPMIAIFYFLIFMPMQRQKKQQARMIAALKAGDEIVSTGGIVGTVVSVAQDTVIVRVKPDNVKLQISRSSVASLVSPEKTPEEKK